MPARMSSTERRGRALNEVFYLEQGRKQREKISWKMMTILHPAWLLPTSTPRLGLLGANSGVIFLVPVSAWLPKWDTCICKYNSKMEFWRFRPIFVLHPEWNTVRSIWTKVIRGNQSPFCRFLEEMRRGSIGLSWALSLVISWLDSSCIVGGEVC